MTTARSFNIRRFTPRESLPTLSEARQGFSYAKPMTAVLVTPGGKVLATFEVLKGATSIQHAVHDGHGIKRLYVFERFAGQKAYMKAASKAQLQDTDAELFVQSDRAPTWPEYVNTARLERAEA